MRVFIEDNRVRLPFIELSRERSILCRRLSSKVFLGSSLIDRRFETDLNSCSTASTNGNFTRDAS